MLMLLAALVQATPAPALDADPGRAAMTCQRAMLTGLTSLPMETSAEFLYFRMVTARALPGTDDYFHRMAAVPTIETVSGVTDANARQIHESCDRRFPLARRPGPVRLPAGAFERDVMCAGVVTVFSGMAQGYREHTGDAAPFNRLQAIAARYQQRATAALLERGLSSEAQRRTIGDQIFASLEIGNAAAISDACEAQQPSG